MTTYCNKCDKVPCKHIRQNNTKKKLTKRQKAEIRIILSANKYFELAKKQTEKESEKWFMEEIEKIINE